MYDCATEQAQGCVLEVKVIYLDVDIGGYVIVRRR
jgi:hypothetical protein